MSKWSATRLPVTPPARGNGATLRLNTSGAEQNNDRGPAPSRGNQNDKPRMNANERESKQGKHRRAWLSYSGRLGGALDFPDVPPTFFLFMKPFWTFRPDIGLPKIKANLPGNHINVLRLGQTALSINGSTHATVP
jgi:hypothetical protein